MPPIQSHEIVAFTSLILVLVVVIPTLGWLARSILIASRDHVKRDEFNRLHDIIERNSNRLTRIETLVDEHVNGKPRRPGFPLF